MFRFRITSLETFCLNEQLDIRASLLRFLLWRIDCRTCGRIKHANAETTTTTNGLVEICSSRTHSLSRSAYEYGFKV